MAMSVVYSNFCGMVVSETRGGVERDYVCDTLGSTIGLMDSTGVMTDRWEYWPCGEVVSHTGTSTTPLTFLSVLGYFKDVLDKLFYVRARHLRVDLARWLTVDPLWPTQPAYAYVLVDPIVLEVPAGTIVITSITWALCMLNALINCKAFKQNCVTAAKACADSCEFDDDPNCLGACLSSYRDCMARAAKYCALQIAAC